MEHFVNSAASTLYSSVSPTDTTLTVHDASSFPDSGSFRILCENELMQVTAVSGTTFTVVRGSEGTTAVAHAANVAVASFVTAAGLAQYCIENASPVTSVAGRTGDVTLSTDDVSGLADVAASGSYNDLTDKPSLSTVATSGVYSDLSGTPDLATVATSGAYSDLTGKPTIPAAQVNSDWNADSGTAQILNKPSLATVATSGHYADLTGKPSLATVATSGSFNDLTDKPTIPDAQVPADWTALGGATEILNKPSLGTAAALNVGTSAHNVVQLDSDGKLPAVDGSQLTGISGGGGDVTSVAGRTGDVTLTADDISGLADVATSGAYSDLSGKPSLATVATTGDYGDLSNTPTLATVATSGSYNDLTDQPSLVASATTDTTNANNITSGTLAIGQGGTGQTTANDALNALLPDQSSANGLVLQSDGTNASWQAGTPGPQGDKGDKGDPGDPGADGAPGPSTTYNVAVGGDSFSVGDGDTFTLAAGDNVTLAIDDGSKTVTVNSAAGVSLPIAAADESDVLTNGLGHTIIHVLRNTPELRHADGGTSFCLVEENGDISFFDSSARKIIGSDSGTPLVGGLHYPSSDGSSGQVLATDGSGNVGFVDATAAGLPFGISSDTAIIHDTNTDTDLLAVSGDGLVISHAQLGTDIALNGGKLVGGTSTDVLTNGTNPILSIDDSGQPVLKADDGTPLVHYDGSNVVIGTDGTAGVLFNVGNGSWSSSSGSNCDPSGNIFCATVVPSNGWSGTYATGDSRIVTVTNGIITDVS